MLLSRTDVLLLGLSTLPSRSEARLDPRSAMRSREGEWGGLNAASRALIDRLRRLPLLAALACESRLRLRASTEARDARRSSDDAMGEGSPVHHNNRNS